MPVPTLEHVALKARDLTRTEAFYRQLGGRVSWHAEGQRLFVEFDGGSRLIFDASDALPDTFGVTYLGVELADFRAVDEAFARLAGHSPPHRDVREDYRTATGPYGFFVRDPNGYTVKVFKYHEAAQ